MRHGTRPRHRPGEPGARFLQHREGGLRAGMAARAGGAPPPPVRARPRTPRDPSKPLNVLFIVTDQEFGLQSYPEGFLDHLPGHRALLERSLHVRNYHVHTTPCTPSRAVIYTGQHTQKTKVYSNAEQGAVLTPEIDTLGDMMRAAVAPILGSGKVKTSTP